MLALIESKTLWVPGVCSLMLFGLVDVLLLSSAVVSFLASGLVRSGGVNPKRLTENERPDVGALKAAEADAWYFSAMVAMESATRKAQDLFRARRLVVWALVIGVPATMLLGVGRLV